MKFFKIIFIVLVTCFSGVVIFSSHENPDFNYITNIPEISEIIFSYAFLPHKYDGECQQIKMHHFPCLDCNYDLNNQENLNYNCNRDAYRNFFKILSHTKNLTLVSKKFNESIVVELLKSNMKITEKLYFGNFDANCDPDNIKTLFNNIVFYDTNRAIGYLRHDMFYGFPFAFQDAIDMGHMLLGYSLSLINLEDKLNANNEEPDTSYDRLSNYKDKINLLEKEIKNLLLRIKDYIVFAF